MRHRGLNNECFFNIVMFENATEGDCKSCFIKDKLWGYVVLFQNDSTNRYILLYGNVLFQKSQ